MAKALFSKCFNFTDTRKGISWRVNPSPDPQEYPARVVNAAIKAGAAARVALGKPNKPVKK
jgi:hypothetical protein